MEVCLIGDGLISLTLAKTLINNKIKVFMYCKNIKKTPNHNRTIGITPKNLDFFQKEIIKVKNIIWEINKIEIYDEQSKNEKILNFEESKKTLFSIFKNDNLYNLLNKELNKSKDFKKIIIKDKSYYKKILNNKKYDLVINCDGNNEISKKYFYRKILKNYESKAYVTTINHNKTQNKKAIQVFTKHGPIAFLPVSETETSIVYSIKNKTINNKLGISQLEFEKLISQNNKDHKIISINKYETFVLKSKTLRNYYYKNILAFGDMLHQTHPLSGQGFNMSLRDISVLLSLIRYRENLGLPIDSSIFKEFQNKTKHLNFIFSSGNDFIYEFFNYDNYYIGPFSKKIFNYLNNSNLFKKLAFKYANEGIVI